MSEIGPPLRAAAAIAFITGIAVLLLDPPSFAGLPGLLVWVIGTVVFVFIAAWATVALIGDELPESEFRRPEARRASLALLPPPDEPPIEFALRVMQALDELPAELRERLGRTPV